MRYRDRLRSINRDHPFVFRRRYSPILLLADAIKNREKFATRLRESEKLFKISLYLDRAVELHVHPGNPVMHSARECRLFGESGTYLPSFSPHVLTNRISRKMLATQRLCLRQALLVWLSIFAIFGSSSSSAYYSFVTAAAAGRSKSASTPPRRTRIMHIIVRCIAATRIFSEFVEAKSRYPSRGRYWIRDIIEDADLLTNRNLPDCKLRPRAISLLLLCSDNNRFAREPSRMI